MPAATVKKEQSRSTPSKASERLPTDAVSLCIWTTARCRAPRRHAKRWQNHIAEKRTIAIQRMIAIHRDNLLEGFA